MRSTLISTLSNAFNRAYRARNVSCCGIVAYSGSQDAVDILCNGVTLLQNRGYDSCGISTIHKKKLVTSKFASKGSTSDSVELLLNVASERHSGHKVGIAHTRWATHGAKTDENAHPHSDWKNRISLVHNGTIDNFDVLRQELLKKGIYFKSETDTEVIANLIGAYLDSGKSFQEAVQLAVDRLRGTWGLVIMHKDNPHGFMAARNGSPMVLGASGGEIFIASEPLALAAYTNECLALNDGDILWISNTGIDHLTEGRDLRKIPKQDVQTDPTPYPHWTIKEIHEQPQSLARALNFGGRLLSTGTGHRVKLGGLDPLKDQLRKINHLLITGCGTSYYAGLYGQLLMRWLDCFDTVELVDSSEVDVDSFPKPAAECGLLAISQSGETRDVVQALGVAETLHVKRLSIVNQVGSLVARMTGCGVYLNAGREVAVASTKAFSSQVAVLGLISLWFAQFKDDTGSRMAQLADALHRLPVTATQLVSMDNQMKEVAKLIVDKKNLFILGKGFGYPVALEGALKIKEISYIHAEGFAGGQLKHGPFALIDEAKRTPVILLIFNDQTLAAMVNAAQQVKSRGAEVIVITDDPNISGLGGIVDSQIVIPSNGPLTALGATIPLQLLAYHLATMKGVNPDKPRGLAKTVTVM